MDALLDKYRVAVAHALDLIVVSDGFGDVAELEAARIRVINRKLLARLGLSAAEVEGWEGAPVGDFFRRYVEDRDMLPVYFERLRTERVVGDTEFHLVCGDRRLCVRVHSRVVPCSVDGYYFQGVFHDITRLRLLEAQLRKEQTERKEWDSFLWHELRGRLGPIVGFSELLIANYNRFSEARIKEFMESIFESGQRLNGILDFIREVQAYERGEIWVEWTDRDVYDTVRGAIEEAAVAVREEMPDHPALWKIAPHRGDGIHPLRVSHDPLKLQRVLRNLLQNAWEQTRETVTLRVEEAEDAVRIHVHNGGEPIPADRLRNIFERFNSTKSGGMGLGTTVARLLVEAHGGRITAASSEEEGTTFTVWLPKRSGEKMERH